MFISGSEFFCSIKLSDRSKLFSHSFTVGPTVQVFAKKFTGDHIAKFQFFFKIPDRAGRVKSAAEFFWHMKVPDRSKLASDSFSVGPTVQKILLTVGYGNSSVVWKYIRGVFMSRKRKALSSATSFMTHLFLFQIQKLR